MFVRILCVLCVCVCVCMRKGLYLRHLFLLVITVMFSSFEVNRFLIYVQDEDILICKNLISNLHATSRDQCFKRSDLIFMSFFAAFGNRNRLREYKSNNSQSRLQLNEKLPTLSQNACRRCKGKRRRRFLPGSTT